MTRVLVVDDEIDTLNLLRTILEISGYQAFTTLNSVDAITLAEVERPDLILLDIMMPTLDGFTLCKLMRMNPATKNLPIVFVTAYSSLDLEDRRKEAGADMVLPKPIGMDTLIEAVEKAKVIRSGADAANVDINAVPVISSTTISPISPAPQSPSGPATPVIPAAPAVAAPTPEPAKLETVPTGVSGTIVSDAVVAPVSTPIPTPPVTESSAADMPTLDQLMGTTASSLPASPSLTNIPAPQSSRNGIPMDDKDITFSIGGEPDPIPAPVPTSTAATPISSTETEKPKEQP